MNVVADLHTHSKASDGSETPSQLVARARALGLHAIALTDHDTTEGLAEVIQAGRRQKLLVIPGIEFSTTWKGTDVHILGYGLQPDSPILLETLAKLIDSRRQRVGSMVMKLQDLGCPVNLERVLAIAGTGSVGRPHIGLALVEAGCVTSIDEAFTSLLGQGRPAYVPRAPFTPEEATQLICATGGLAVLAHPGTSNCASLISTLVGSGLGGIECYYPEHTPETVRFYLQVARTWRLLVTGGSDYHGEGVTLRFELGSTGVGEVELQKVIDNLKL